MAKSVRLFELASHAADYVAFRPTYSKSVIDVLLDYVSRRGGGGFDRAVDLACGSGQSTFPLCKDFRHCVGIDISPEQIAQARAMGKKLEITNAEFKVADATHLPVESSSVDLITIATAWHWITDKDRLYSECKRVLKPGGCLAVYSYNLVKIEDPVVTELIHTFYAKLDAYWHPEFNYIRNNYRDVVLPFSEVERFETTMCCRTSLPGLIGFLASLSSYRTYLKKCPVIAASDLQQLKQAIEEKLDKADGRKSPNKEVQSHYDCLDTFYPVHLILGLN